MPILFKDIRNELYEKLKNIQDDGGGLGIDEPTRLCDGIFQPFFSKDTTVIEIQGKPIPQIMLLGERTGRIYYFSLRMLMPHLYDNYK